MFASNRTIGLLCALALLAGGAAARGVQASPAAQEADARFDPALIERGREIFGLACVQCHGANQTVIQRKTFDGWRSTVYSMIARGAQVLPDEIEPLTLHLAATYGPASPLPAFGPSDTLPPEPSELIGRSCGGCHAVNIIYAARKSASEWTETVQEMRSLGAALTDSEVEELVLYLTERFGPAEP